MKFLSDILAKAGLTVDGVVTLNNTATGQTPAANDNSTKLATTAWVRGFVTPYSLPIASGLTLGGIKIGSGLAIDGTGIVSVAATGVGAIRALQQFTATAGQTVFTVSGGYTPGLIDVFLNGVLLTPTSITASNGTTFTLSDAALVNDVLDVFVYNPIYGGFISSTDQVPEGATNLYFTNARARAAISLTTTGVSGVATYNSSTGVFNIPNYQGLVPSGGTAGQILSKVDGTDYNTQWLNEAPASSYTSQLKHVVKSSQAITKGQAVYVSSADGTNMIVSKASNATEATSSKTMGLLESTVSINGTANVVTEGLLAGLNTTGANAAGDPVWLGTDGNLIYGLVNKPVAPAHLVFIGVVTRRNANNGEIFVKVQNGFEFNELHDVAVLNPTDGDMIKYVASTGLWTKIAATTTNITEGTRLYYTDARARAAISVTGSGSYDSATGVITVTGGVTSVNTLTGAVTLTTTNIAEGTNLYYTDVRVGSYLTTNSYATQTYVGTQIANLVASAPATLDTLNELAAALGNDPSFATTVATSIGTKVPQTRTITINGTGYDLSADRSWTIASGVTSFNTRTGAITSANGDYTTAQVTESGNLYYTDTRVRAAISLTTTGTSGAATYDSATGIFNIPQYQGGVTSFNTRTGAISLTSSDVTTALTYTPVTNARTLTINGTAYDLTADRTWTIGVSPSARTIQTYTATAAQTTFTVTGGYVVGLVDVFINGVRLTSADFTATNGTTVVLTTGTGVNNIVDVIKYTSAFTASSALRQVTYFTATAGQTSFTVSYTPGLVDVYYNGSKLSSSEYTASNGTTIVLANAAVVNDALEVISYAYSVGAFAGLSTTRTLTINGTSYDLSADRTWTLTTSNISEGSNLYYTDTRARAAISLTTTGSSGASTYASGVINIPTYTLSGLGGQTELNGTGLVRMSGTTVSYDNATYATQSYVTTAVANLVNSAPSTLDTLNELATALGNDANFATTVTTSIGTKQAQLNGTGFVKISGTTISYDNNSYYLASNPNSYITLASLSVTGPLTYNSSTGAFNINKSSSTVSGWLSYDDWVTFNSKQPAGNYVTTDTTQSISGAKTFTTQLWIGSNAVIGGSNGQIQFDAAASSDLFISCIPGTRTVQIRNGNSGAPNYSACGLITGYATFAGLLTGQASIYQSDPSGVIASNRWGTYNGGSTAMTFAYNTSGSVVWTNNLDRMFLTGDGYLGVGITPTYPLHITSTIANYTAGIINTSSGNNAGLLIKAGINSGNEILRCQTGTGANRFLIDVSGEITSTDGEMYFKRTAFDNYGHVYMGSNRHFYVRNSGPYNVYLQTNNVNQITLQNDGVTVISQLRTSTLYSDFAINLNGSYSNGTYYKICDSSQLTTSGIYMIVAYVDTYAIGGGTYFCTFASVPFYWFAGSSNSGSIQTLPTMLGTGHHNLNPPIVRIRLSTGASSDGGKQFLEFDPNSNWSNVQGTGGATVTFYVKRIGS